MKMKFYKLLLFTFSFLLLFGCSTNGSAHYVDATLQYDKDFIMGPADYSFEVKVEKGYLEKVSYTVYGEAMIEDQTKKFEFKRTKYTSSNFSEETIKFYGVLELGEFGKIFSAEYTEVILKCKILFLNIKDIKFTFRKSGADNYVSSIIASVVGVAGIGSLVYGCVFKNKEENN